MRCIYVDFFLPRWPVTIFSDIRNKKISSSDQSILALGDVSNTSSTSSVKIITSPKCKIINVIDVSSSDCSSNYGSSLSISTLTISTKVRMPPSSMKGKRESNENASNMSDLDTSSEEEDSYANLAPAKRSRILEEFTRLMVLSSQKQWGAGSKHSTGNGWEGGRQREKKKQSGEPAASRLLLDCHCPRFRQCARPLRFRNEIWTIKSSIRWLKKTIALNNHPNINDPVEGQYVLFVDLSNTPTAQLSTGVRFSIV